MRTRNAILACAMFLVIIIAAGCGPDLERVELPPVVDMQGAKTLAVLPFENYSDDPGLALAFQEELSRSLKQSGYYAMVDSSRAAAILADAQISPRQADSPSTVRKIGDLLDADAVITGRATYYFEDVAVDVPRKVSSHRTDQPPNWLVDRETTIMTTFKVRVIDARTGDVLHSASVQGEDRARDVTYLPWHDESPPQPSLIPPATRIDIPRTRSVAIERAVNNFSKDILPRYRWRTVR